MTRISRAALALLVSTAAAPASASVDPNAITVNAITANALTANALTANALTANG